MFSKGIKGCPKARTCNCSTCKQRAREVAQGKKVRGVKIHCRDHDQDCHLACTKK